MLGSIIGDIAGTKYEYKEFIDSKNGIINIDRRKEILNTNIELIQDCSFISDDTMLTVAIAEAILKGKEYKDVLKEYGIKYSNEYIKKEDFFESPFSPTFVKWANQEVDVCGTSKGNGASMRVSPIAYMFNDLNTVLDQAKKSAIPSHNSKEAIKGAQCIAAATFLARKKYSKNEIKSYLTEKYEYNFEYNLDELQENNTFDGSSEKTVPQAIYVFLISENFEDAIRKAISIGGDTDTVACMVGGISEAYYKIPKQLGMQALKILPEEFRKTILNAYEFTNKKDKKNKKNKQEGINKDEFEYEI